MYLSSPAFLERNSFSTFLHVFACLPAPLSAPCQLAVTHKSFQQILMSHILSGGKSWGRRLSANHPKFSAQRSAHGSGKMVKENSFWQSQQIKTGSFLHRAALSGVCHESNGERALDGAGRFRSLNGCNVCTLQLCCIRCHCQTLRLGGAGFVLLPTCTGVPGAGQHMGGKGWQ